MQIKNSTLGATMVYGVAVDILKQVEGPVAGKSWIAYGDPRSRMLTDAEVARIQGAQEYLDQGDVWGALAFLKSLDDEQEQAT